MPNEKLLNATDQDNSRSPTLKLCFLLSEAYGVSRQCCSPQLPVFAAGVPDYVPEEEHFFAADEGYSTPPEELGMGFPAMGSPVSHISEAGSPQAQHFSAAAEAEQGTAPRPASAVRRSVSSKRMRCS